MRTHLIGRMVHFTPDGRAVLPAVVLAMNERHYADLLVFTRAQASPTLQQFSVIEDPSGKAAVSWRWPPSEPEGPRG